MVTNSEKVPLPAIPIKPAASQAVPAVPVRPQETRRPPEAQRAAKAMRNLRVPWVRIFVLLVYLCLVTAAIGYEMQARKLLERGRNLEQAQKYRGAVLAYSLVVEKFPYSLAAADARQGLVRTEEANVQGSRICMTQLETLLGNKASPYEIDQFCLAAFALSAALLLLTALGRTAFGIPSGWCWVLIVLALGCTFLLSYSYGFVDDSPTAQTINQYLLSQPFAPQAAALFFLAMPLLLSLTGKRRRVTS